MSVMPTGYSVTQFQYLRWPEESAPNTTSTILEIANLVQKVQMSTGNKAIIVMCKSVHQYLYSWEILITERYQVVGNDTQTDQFETSLQYHMHNEYKQNDISYDYKNDLYVKI